MVDGWTLLDVRTPAEHGRGHPRLRSTSPSTRSATARTLGGDPSVVYCEVGQRATPPPLLHELGIEARNLDGGYQTWIAADAAAARGRHVSLRCPAKCR